VTLQELFEANRPLFYTLYGQVFFLLGVAIALRARRDSDIPLARPLWLLSAFGFAHGLYEWSYVILPVQKVYLTGDHLRALGNSGEAVWGLVYHRSNGAVLGFLHVSVNRAKPPVTQLPKLNNSEKTAIW